MLNKFVSIARDVVKLHKRARDGFDDLEDKSSTVLEEYAWVRSHPNHPDADKRLRAASQLLNQISTEQRELFEELVERQQNISGLEELLEELRALHRGDAPKIEGLSGSDVEFPT